MAVYYAYNTTDLYLSNSDLSNDATYGTTQGYTCGIYSSDDTGEAYNQATCTTITILNEIKLSENASFYFYNFQKVIEIKNLSYLNTSNVTNMYCMFYGCQSLTSLNLSKFNTSNVTDMRCMFCDCSSLTSLDLSNFETSNVTDMAFMFEYCLSLVTLDLSNFNTSNVTDMSEMFCNYNWESGTSAETYPLKTIYANDFDISKVTDYSYMFSDCYSLVGAISYDSTKTDATYANTTSGYFTSPSKKKSDDTDDTETATSISVLVKCGGKLIKCGGKLMKFAE